jgi:hypothetical protein
MNSVDSQCWTHSTTLTYLVCHRHPPAHVAAVLDVVHQQAGRVQRVDDLLDGLHLVLGDLQPHVERIDEVTTDVFTGNILEVVVWLQQLNMRMRQCGHVCICLSVDPTRL